MAFLQTVSRADTAIQRRTIALLSVAQVLSGVGAGAVVATGSLLTVELSGADAWAGSVTTAMTLGAAFASALLARFAHVRGRRRALSADLLVAAVGALAAVVAGVALATVGYAGLGIAGTVVGVVALAATIPFRIQSNQSQGGLS